MRGRSGHDKAIAAVGAYLRVSGPLGRYERVRQNESNTTHSNDKI
ncbi:hypothetical protein [Klebsiella pneumoniae]